MSILPGASREAGLQYVNGVRWYWLGSCNDISSVPKVPCLKSGSRANLILPVFGRRDPAIALWCLSGCLVYLPLEKDRGWAIMGKYAIPIQRSLLTFGGRNHKLQAREEDWYCSWRDAMYAGIVAVWAVSKSSHV